ncbi:glucan 1,3-alpha-glucosidase ROT2 KNAG_0M00730 [Huiozyma naganishii CBS 8797]|uniref:Glucosidase II subunit alpha n=1 Tax=Huiozyma naganishii (strain ATCC MYA-139 / BCRC 22969 / CBS 8797 / KCTC 17520 / NBRC 10181 / NCYC 3082 / Yp74L-3) TaxID=1071383 RepID=J7SBB6_HUIN7|nr:hypothetical protein KNAG_0M00730 [Kazachstania naganishii CBS 8797]CCK72926.1 hypothetical protein KNAG_0M00730 [Kazachstania naganishii CBS 8797]
MMVRSVRMHVWVVLVLALPVAHAFADYLLKTCSQASFCQRNRLYAQNIASSPASFYSVDTESVQFRDNVLWADVVKHVPRTDIDDIKVRLPLRISFIAESAIRFTINEDRYEQGCKNSGLVQCERFNGTWDWAVDGKHIAETPLNLSHRLKTTNKWSFSKTQGGSVMSLANDHGVKVDLQMDRFHMQVYRDNVLQMSINDRDLFNWEHYRTIEENFHNVNPQESTFNMFKDDFSYSQDDDMPMGPESVAMDFTFHNVQNVYGIPEHADSLRLRDTTGSEPYRLFNVDVFEYNLQSKMPMYGAIPLMIGASASDVPTAMGIFWLNAADTWIDINYKKQDTTTHWMSENGVMDVVMFFGDTANDVTKQYTELTGNPTLPLMSSIGYHQCRWNYNDELDVLTVEDSMDKNQFPFDFIWLDLDYTDKKQYFTWNADSFPNPRRMLNKLARLGRNLAILIDPHLMDGYEVSDIIKREEVEVKKNDNYTFFGQCWPGRSIWIDTMAQAGRTVWAKLFHDFVNKYASPIANNLHIWNDMNEPSIFSGPETTAPKDLLHDGGFEERSIHNVYGLSVHETTYDSMREAYNNNTRPFILTRAFFAGSQRSAATWTGDNMATWEYLQISIPMVLTNNIAGMPFIGADIAGFAGDPEEELLIRWYQAGLWYPFFRAHAHIDTKRREPYLFEEPTKSLVRDSIRLRYALLPVFYTAFHEASVSGTPILKPMFYEKPQHQELYDIDNQFYLGDSGIVVKPVLHPGVSKTSMLLAPGIYYDLTTFETLYVSGQDAKSVEVDAPLHKLPAYIEGGNILTTRERYRRSSSTMRHDPYVLLIAPAINGFAQGDFYVDDGESFQYEQGEYLTAQFKLENNILFGVPTHVPANVSSVGSTLIEKIVIPVSDSDVKIGPTVKITQDSVERTVDAKKLVSDGVAKLVIENSLVSIDKHWQINLV